MTKKKMFIKKFKVRKLSNLKENNLRYCVMSRKHMLFNDLTYQPADKQLFDYFSIMIQLQIQQSYIIVKPYRKC